MIRFEADSALLRASVSARERNFVLETRLQQGAAEKMTVNGISVRRAPRAAACFFTVYFCPEDLFLIRDGAAAAEN